MGNAVSSLYRLVHGASAMVTLIRVRCPGCDARIKAPSLLIGRTRGCPGCGRLFVVRTKAPTDAAPVLSDDELPTVLKLPKAG